MAYNPSLATFKKEMSVIQERARNGVRERMVQVANEIADNMRSAAPKDEGALAASVRVKDVSRTYGNRVRAVVQIRAGGPTTLRRNKKTGQLYDYSAAVEFGTREMTAEPFFYNTFRRYNSVVADVVAETLQEAISKNSQILAGRASGSIGGGSTRVQSSRGSTSSKSK